MYINYSINFYASISWVVITVLYSPLSSVSHQVFLISPIPTWLLHACHMAYTDLTLSAAPSGSVL